MTKIAVYTIALNEENFAARWVESVKEADYLIVADTGSTDNTVPILRSLGVQVYDISIKPWRFDHARNTAMSLIPSDADVCLSLDMDEMMAPGWRSKVDQAWQPGTTRLRYTYVHSFDSSDNPLISYNADKCHARYNYTWKRPVHETVFSDQDECVVSAMDVIMWQKQDVHKSRGQYLPLLELSHKENSECAQTLFWLARDYAYQQQPEAAITHFKKFLLMPHAWDVEKSEAQRWLSKLLPQDKLFWLRQAMSTAPYRRESWMDLAEHYYHNADWLNCLSYATEGIKISHKSSNYLDTPEAWGAKLPDLAGIGAWNLGLRDMSLEFFEQAVALAPEDDRIRNNLTTVKAALGK